MAAGVRTGPEDVYLEEAGEGYGVECRVEGGSREGVLGEMLGEGSPAAGT